MPELPEVQTIVDDLRKTVRGWEVADFYSAWKRNVIPQEKQVKKKMIGLKIEDVERRGKYILIHFQNGDMIIAHLRMTGSLIAQMQNSKCKIQNDKVIDQEKFVRHWWKLKKGSKELILYFSDVRKFGTVEFVEKGEKSKLPGINNLGAELLDETFSARKLEDILKKYPQKTIRQLLLDQNIIAGIGNIYASEILHDAAIHPSRPCASLSASETRKLRGTIRKILSKAIKERGTTISDYRDSRGEQGSFQNLLMVYNRQHERCRKKGCRGTIQKAKLQGRSAFWCSDCQSL